MNGREVETCSATRLAGLFAGIEAGLTALVCTELGMAGNVLLAIGTAMPVERGATRFAVVIIGGIIVGDEKLAIGTATPVENGTTTFGETTTGGRIAGVDEWLKTGATEGRKLGAGTGEI